MSNFSSLLERNEFSKMEKHSGSAGLSVSEGQGWFFPENSFAFAPQIQICFPLVL